MATAAVLDWRDEANNSHDSLDFDQSETSVRMTREDVLSALGYRAQSRHKPSPTAGFSQRRDSCHRCGKKVYQVERLDVGELYHRGCFKCHVCGMQLTLKTFHRVATDAAKQIYCRTHLPRIEMSLSRDSPGVGSAFETKKTASDKVVQNFIPEALQLQHSKQLLDTKTASALKTNVDYENSGVYEAQAELEKRHQKEEDELYRQIFEERQRLMRNLEEVLLKEKEHTVKELIVWFENQGSSEHEQKSGLKKLEQFYAEERESRIKKLLDGMMIDERAAVDRMVEKHAQEMLFLIEEKEKEAVDKLASRKGDDSCTITESPQKHRQFKEDAEEQEDEEVDSNDEFVEDEVLDEDALPEGSGTRGDEIPQGGDWAEVNVDAETDDDDDDDDDDDEYLASSGRNAKTRGISDVVIVSETPVNDILRLEMVSKQKSRKVTSREMSSQRSLLETADEGTQTYEPVPKQRRSISQMSGSSSVTKPSKGKRQQRASESPRAKTRHSQSPRSQFQLIVSTERLTDAENRQRQLALQQQQQLLQQRERKLNSSMNSPYASPRTKTSKGAYKDKETDDDDDDDDDNESVMMSAQPSVQPPTCRKARLYKTPEIFSDLDKRAIQEAQKDPTSFTDLVRRLTWKCRTDLQKVRAIFRWITAKDLNKMKFTGNESTDSPLGLLKGIKSGTESYHNLFKRLCSYAGIHCQVIEGFSKGAGYHPGSKFSGDRFRNQWTAVWVDDSWRFINCNWGARHVKQAGDNHLTYKIDEFYFLTDPDEHIYQHFPDDSRWQLLKRPITLDEFVHLPVVKSPFFNHGLEFVGKIDSVLKASDGKVEFRLRAPTLLGFAVKLKSRDKNVSEKILKECCVIRILNDQVICLLDIPAPGQFYCEVFVDSCWTSKSMDNACSFLMRCSRVSSPRSYPQVGCFGPTPLCESHKIREERNYDPLIIATGEITLGFKLSDKTLRLSHSLRQWNPKEHALIDCDRYAFLRSRMNSTAAFFVRCPSAGIYVLNLHLSDRTENKTKPVFYRYLIDCVAAVKRAPTLPHSSSKWYGCHLVEPLVGELHSNSQMTFRVESNHATEIVASVNGQWVALNKSQSTWQATIATGKPGKLCLYGRFESSKDKYVPLWEFLVKEATAVDEVRALFKYL